jgi:predicted RND superfamily exporter protein
VVTGAMILFAVSLFYTFQVSYSHDILNWISRHEKIQQDVPYIDKHLKGSVVLEVILNTKTDDGIKNPILLKKIQTIIKELKKYNRDKIIVGKIFSINDVIMEINQSMFDNDPDFYTLPDNQAAVSQELLLFENAGSDNLESLTDKNYKKTRISIKIPWTDAIYLKNFIDHVHMLFYREFQESATITITGIPALLARSIPVALLSMSKSYLVAFIVITLLMIVHVGSVKIGLLSMISNLLPIFITMGIMGLFKIKLDMSTIMIGSIAIGIVVDDTLHFIYNFRKYYETTKDASYAIRKTMLGTGRALLLTSLILCTGFFILMTASLSLLVVFGALTGLTIIFALLADFILNPALMILITKKESKITTMKT